MNDTKSKITDPARIQRVLAHICAAGIQVVIRTEGNQTLAIKGRASHLIMDGNARGVRMTGISERGMDIIRTVDHVQVEFVMMATKVVFLAKVLLREENGIVTGVPTSLVSLERRKNARFYTTPEVAAYIKLSNYSPTPDDWTAMPFFSNYTSLGGLSLLADISPGGICAVTRFPGFLLALPRGHIDQGAQIIFPMREPIPVAIEVRWTKKIREQPVTGPGGMPSAARCYRFGLEFRDPSEALVAEIRQFIQRIVQAGAV